jgi:hypothetical protein
LDDSKPRIVDGENVYVTQSGKIARAPGLYHNAAYNPGTFASTLIPYRIVTYETLENPPKVYLVASVFNTATISFQIYYARIGTTGWTALANNDATRWQGYSTQPH